MKKKILILGGSHRDIPLIEAAQELDFFVITLGDRDYYLGHQYSDKSYKVDFNNLEKIKEIVKHEKVDYLLPGSGEASYLNTVQLSHELEMGCFDDLTVGRLVHNKGRFKEFCLENAISTPTGVYYTDDLNLESVKLPVIVKPTDLSGGRGIEVAYDLSSLKAAIAGAQETSGEIFLEEFIEGELIAYSVFIKDSRVAYGFTGKDDTYKNKYLITSAYPICLAPETQKKLQLDVETIANMLSLVDGMFHLQVIVEGLTPYIIDVTRRIPGDFYPYLIEYCDRVEYSKAVVKSYIGQALKQELNPKGGRGFVIRHCVMSDRNGLFKNIKINKSIEDRVIFRIDLKTENTEITNFLTEQIAIIFIRPSDESQKIIDNINDLIYPVIV